MPCASHEAGRRRQQSRCACRYQQPGGRLRHRLGLARPPGWLHRPRPKPLPSPVERNVLASQISGPPLSARPYCPLIRRKRDATSRFGWMPTHRVAGGATSTAAGGPAECYRRRRGRDWWFGRFGGRAAKLARRRWFRRRGGAGRELGPPLACFGKQRMVCGHCRDERVERLDRSLAIAKRAVCHADVEQDFRQRAQAVRRLERLDRSDELAGVIGLQPFLKEPFGLAARCARAVPRQLLPPGKGRPAWSRSTVHLRGPELVRRDPRALPHYWRHYPRRQSPQGSASREPDRRLLATLAARRVAAPATASVFAGAPSATTIAISAARSASDGSGRTTTCSSVATGIVER